MIHNQKRDGTKYQRSSLEKKFERLWVQKYPQLDLFVEQKIIPDRRFRCDYLHKPSKTVIEIHGGQYLRHSGHSSSRGVKADAEKHNLLMVNGYKVFVLWTSQVNRENIKLIGDYISSSSI